MSDDSSSNHPDTLPSSPFAQADPTACPFAPDPKLSIRHLMVWAVCVAVYMSAFHTITINREEYRLEGVRVAFFGLWALVGGAYLAIIPLMVSRWYQRQTFPRSGGEILWIIGAISVLLSLVSQLLYVVTEDGYLANRATRAVAGVFVWFPAFLYAIRVCRGHWRAYYLFAMIAGFVWYFSEGVLQRFPGNHAMFVGSLVHLSIFTLVLGLVAWIDFRRVNCRYPWPHWMGIFVGFAFNAVSALWWAYYLVQAVFQQESW